MERLPQTLRLTFPEFCGANVWRRVSHLFEVETPQELRDRLKLPIQDLVVVKSGTHSSFLPQ